MRHLPGTYLVRQVWDVWYVSGRLALKMCLLATDESCSVCLNSVIHGSEVSASKELKCVSLQMGAGRGAVRNKFNDD